jgi:nucleoside-diphosphate-sugar epimerase
MFDLPEIEGKGESKDQEEPRGFDYVFNCAEPLTHRNYHVSDNQKDDVFLQQAKSVTNLLSKQCAIRRIPVYIELSTGNVYKSSARKPASEADGKIKPQTSQAKWKLEIEEQLRKLCTIPDDKVDPKAGRIDACVLRLANVYGLYVTKFLGQALCLARVYQAEEKEMRWLWGEDMRTDTVHVEDTVEAMWATAEWLFKTPRSKRDVLPIFNIVDGGKTSA